MVLLDRKHFKVKLLRFRRGGRLSLQTHQLRREMWLFLCGSGIVTKGTKKTMASNGQVMIIPRRIKHSYAAERVTWVLEVQYGDKCTEEDIVRV